MEKTSRLKNAVPLVIIALYIFVTAALGDAGICFFKLIYGIPCPGCGLTRSLTSLIRGNVLDAFHYHPMFPLVLAAPAAVLLRKHEPFRSLIKSQPFWISIIVLFLLQWAVRMLLYFPDIPPMDVNRNALILTAIRQFAAAAPHLMP